MGRPSRRPPVKGKACASVLAALALVAPAVASAQGRDLGELAVTLPRASSGSMVLVVRLDVPEPADADLPAVAVPLHARWREARSALADAHARRIAAPTDAEAARITASLTSLERALDTARDELSQALEAALDTLSRPALLRLGMLRHDVAEGAFLRELDALDACVAAMTADCPLEPRIDDAPALAIWSRVTGSDVTAAYALYERAESLEDAGDREAALPLLEAALAIPGLPPALDAASAMLLGAVSALDDAAAVARTYGRCAALAVPDVSPRCALLAGDRLAALGREDEALSALASLLGAGDPLAADAEVLAADVVAQLGAGGAEHLPATLGPGVRARVLDLGAGVLANAGLLTWSLEALAAAQALEPSPAREARIAETEHARVASPDDPERWLRRAIRFCAGRSRPLAGTFTLRWRFSSRGAAPVRFTIGRDPLSVLRPLGACLRDHAPPPESPMGGSFSAHVRLESE